MRGSLTTWQGEIGRLAVSALNADTTFWHTQARYRIWRRDSQKELCHLGLRFQEEEPQVQQKAVRCDQCEASFCDQKALSVHRYKVHQQHAQVRAYMDSTTCGACLKDYHTIQKLRQHLQHRPERCLRKLQNLWFPLDASVLRDFKPPNEVKHAHRLPALQCFGPMLPSREEWELAKPGKQFPAEMQDDADGVPPIIPPEESSMATQGGDSQDKQVDDDLFHRIVDYIQDADSPFQPPNWDLLHANTFSTLVAFGDFCKMSCINNSTPSFMWKYTGGLRVCLPNISSNSEARACRSNPTLVPQRQELLPRQQSLMICGCTTEIVLWKGFLRRFQGNQPDFRLSATFCMPTQGIVDQAMWLNGLGSSTTSTSSTSPLLLWTWCLRQTFAT